MSLTYSGPVSAPAVRRVRDQVREGLAVIAFSAIASSALAAVLMVFLGMVGRAS